MTTEFPIKRWLVSMILLFFVALGSTSAQYGRPQYDIALFRIITGTAVLSIPAIIAYNRRLIKRNTIYWLSFCWIIPFSWLIALFMAIFGKSEPADNSDAVLSTEQNIKVKQKPVDNKTEFAYTTKYNINYQIPDNAIDRAFYQIGHGTINAARTVKNSRVVRGAVSALLKLLLVLAIFAAIVLIAVIIESK